jgi:hypothetical protein
MCVPCDLKSEAKQGRRSIDGSCVSVCARRSQNWGTVIAWIQREQDMIPGGGGENGSVR